MTVLGLERVKFSFLNKEFLDKWQKFEEQNVILILRALIVF